MTKKRRYSHYHRPIDCYTQSLFPCCSNDHRVAAVRINHPYFLLSGAVREEIEQMRGLRHPNVAGFIGICPGVDAVWIVSEFCSRGNLIEALKNNIINDWEFR